MLLFLLDDSLDLCGKLVTTGGGGRFMSLLNWGFQKLGIQVEILSH